jgi:hypothetical protein
VLAGQVDVPDGRRLIRIFAGVVRSSNQTTVRFPAESIPIRGNRCAAVPGSSLTLTSCSARSSARLKHSRSLRQQPCDRSGSDPRARRSLSAQKTIQRTSGSDRYDVLKNANEVDVYASAPGSARRASPRCDARARSVRGA